jgi:hypothetical protein
MFPARLNILSLGTEDNKKPRLNMDWFDDVVLVATEGSKFTKAEIVENEVTRYVSEPSSTVDPLTWWRERAPTYPIIVILYVFHLCFI